MNLLGKCNEKVTLERQDGSRHEQISAFVTGNMILIPDAKIPIESNDVILRQLPSGPIERLIVTDPGFYNQSFAGPAHYQVKYRRERQRPAGSPVYHIHQNGENSRVNIDSVDQSSNTVTNQNYDTTALAIELSQLRDALLSKAKEPEHYSAIGTIANAEIQAKAGDRTKVSQALAGLGSAGLWALDVAKETSALLAAELIKAQIGS